MQNTAEQELFRQVLSDPIKIDRELQQFRKSAETLSSSQSRMVDTYPKEWVVLYNGKVEVHEKDFNDALVAAEKLGLPRENIIIRFIEKNPTTIMILLGNPC